MRKTLVCGLVAVAMAAGASFVRAEDKDKGDAKEKTITGVVIDNACAGKPMKAEDPEAAAAKHPKTCALKESCAKSGYSVISGKEQYKLDKDSAEKVKEFLGEEKSTTHVVVMGKTNEDGTLSLSSIKAAPEKKDEKKE